MKKRSTKPRRRIHRIRPKVRPTKRKANRMQQREHDARLQEWLNGVPGAKQPEGWCTEYVHVSSVVLDDGDFGRETFEMFEALVDTFSDRLRVKTILVVDTSYMILYRGDPNVFLELEEHYRKMLEDEHKTVLFSSTVSSANGPQTERMYKEYEKDTEAWRQRWRLEARSAA